MTKRNITALEKRFKVADARFMELLLRGGDFPSPADVTAWNTWHTERAEVAEELAAIYGELQGAETGIGGLVWRAYDTTRQHWEQQAEQHRGHIRQPEEDQ